MTFGKSDLVFIIIDSRCSIGLCVLLVGGAILLAVGSISFFDTFFLCYEGESTH